MDHDTRADVHAARELHEAERKLSERTPVPDWAEVIAKARNDALEEAAAICDGVAVDGLTKLGGSAEPWMRATAEDCARYIRRRISK